MKLLLFFSFFCIYNLSFCQNLVLSGKVVDTEGKPVAFANAILFTSDGLEVVSGSSTNEEGVFKIEKLSLTDYLLKTSFLGYESTSQPITLFENKNIGVLVLKPSLETLDGVTVNAKKPTFKKEVDRLIFNVENTSLIEGSMLDVLSSTPGVLVLGDVLSVKNSNPTVFINNRKVHLSTTELNQLLSNSSANSIQKIEVITNPPAKYDADSGVVLNIVMSKNLITGYRGLVFANYTQGVFPRYNGGISQYYKNKKINVNLNYSYNHSKINRENNDEVNYLNNNLITEHWAVDLNRNTTSKTHDANLNFDYLIDENNTISISSYLIYLPYFDYLINGKTDVNDIQGLDNYNFNSINHSKDDKYNLGTDLDYKLKFKDDSELLINTHFTKYDYNRKQNVNSNYYDANNLFDYTSIFNTINNQTTEILTSQLDYELSVSKTANLSVGIKTTNINTDSDITQFDIDSTSGYQTLNAVNTNAFNYNESVFAGYISYAKNWDKWSVSGGVRAEQTNLEGVSSTTSMNNKQDYLELFPTLNLTWQAFEKASLYTNYKRSIDRPNFKHLNPFQFYLNDNTIVTGNPSLQPTFTNSFVVGSEINQHYTVEVYYKDVSNKISELPLQDNTNSLLKYSPTNIKRTTDFGFDFITYFDLQERWSVYFFNSIYNMKESLNLNTEMYSLSQWTNYFVLSNDFSFLKDNSLKANLTLVHTSKFIQGLQVADGSLSSDLSFSKKVFKNKGALSLAFSDLFNKQDFIVRSKYGNQNSQSFSDLDYRYVKFGFSYKFGNTTLETNERTKSLKERERL